MEQITKIRVLEDFRLEIWFSDGTHGTVDISERLFGPVFEPLRDPEFFGQVFVDEFGAPCWPNGADLAPDALYEELRSSTSNRT